MAFTSKMTSARPIIESYSSLVQTTTAGYASAVTGATWTLTATTPGDGAAHPVTIKNDTSNSHSSLTALLTGTDANNNPITETMAMPAGSTTTTSVGYFQTLTSIVPSATIGADTMDIGWTAVAVTKIIPLDHRVITFNVSVAAIVTDSNLNVTLQQTVDDPMQSNPSLNCTWFTNSSISSVTASTLGSISVPVRAIRMLVNSVGATGKTLTIKVLEGRP